MTAEGESGQSTSIKSDNACRIRYRLLPINLSLPMTDEAYVNSQSDSVAVLKARASTIRVYANQAEFSDAKYSSAQVQIKPEPDRQG